jgi:putative hydrolase of the HAD superfamily
MNSTLKAIIFDVGGVLIVTHNRAGREKWAARFGLDPWAFENFVFSGESGSQMQLGQKSTAAHWQWLGQHFGLSQIELKEMHRDFFAGDRLNQALVAYVKLLRQAGYKTGILSNFGDEARQLWTDTYPFIEHFDGLVISAEVGLMKPHPHIYHLAANSLGVAPAEAVFVDDFVENIEGARRVGMQAIHYTGADGVITQLEQLTGVT